MENAQSMENEYLQTRIWATVHFGNLPSRMFVQDGDF